MFILKLVVYLHSKTITMKHTIQIYKSMINLFNKDIKKLKIKTSCIFNEDDEIMNITLTGDLDNLKIIDNKYNLM